MIRNLLISSMHNFYMSKYKGQVKMSAASEEEDYYILQPMFQKLPPNELISQKYAPDVVPQVKLITNKDDRRNNAQFLPPKTRNPELQAYASLFHTFDYIGTEYANKINQLVYLKFNNNRNNLVPEAKHKTRVLPAFYVPFQQLYSEFETCFTKNLGLPFPQSNNQSLFPNAKNNKGCSFDPIFSSHHQSANLFAVFRKNPFDYELILQNDVNSCQSVEWFNFSVQFSEEGYYSFRIKNITTNLSKLFQNGMKITYCQLNSLPAKPQKKAGEGWSLCGQNISFAQGTIQNELKPGEKYYQLYFQYRCKNKHQIAMFALQCPYNLLETERFFNEVMFKKVRGMTKIQRIQYGRTIAGSALSAFLIRKKKARGETVQAQHSETQLPSKDRRSINLSPLAKFTPNSSPDSRNKSVVIIARLAAADVGSSFIIEGMVQYLLDSLDYETLKRTINFYFFPLSNVDGVKHGNTLTNLTGSNLLGDWRHPNKVYQAEIYYLKQLLNQINKENPISLVVNLTPQPEELFTSVLGFKNENEDCEDSRIFPYVLSKRNKSISFQNSHFFDKHENNSMCCVLGDTLSGALVYQFKISHFQPQKTPEEICESTKFQDLQLKQCTPDSYRNWGRQLLANYLEHVKLYDRNILLRDKWMKEITEIDNKLGKRQYKTCTAKPTEQRFPDKFYAISSLRDIPSATDIKTCNNLLPPRASKSRKYIEIGNQPHLPLRKEKTSARHHLPQTFNEIMSKRKYNGIMETKTEIIDQRKKDSGTSEKSIQKPFTLFRIAQKKTSILKNCIPNTLNFDIEGENRELKKSRNDRSHAQKELLKKQLSTKLLRKVKIEDTLKRRASKQKLGDIINNL